MNVSRRQHIVISYGILVAFLATIVFALVIPPVARRFELLSSIDASRALYRQSQATIAAESDDVGNSVIDEALLLTASTDALAGAELQQAIKQIVEANGALLVSTAFRRSENESPLKEVPVAVRLRSSIQSLATILQEIDERQPRLYVRDLVVQSRHGHGRVLRNLQEELEVQFNVVGYLLPESAEP